MEIIRKAKKINPKYFIAGLETLFRKYGFWEVEQFARQGSSPSSLDRFYTNLGKEVEITHQILAYRYPSKHGSDHYPVALVTVGQGRGRLRRLPLGTLQDPAFQEYFSSRWISKLKLSGVKHKGYSWLLMEFEDILRSSIKAYGTKSRMDRWGI